MDEASSKTIANSILDRAKQFLDDVEVHYDNDNAEFNALRDGFDFFEVRNTLMCSYLIDITRLISLKLEAATTKGNKDSKRNNSDDDNNNHHSEELATKRRLLEMKVILDKMRPMNQKLAYQTKKLLSFADTPAVVDNNNNNNGEEYEYLNRRIQQQEGPISFGPNPDALMDSEDDEEYDDDDNEGGTAQYHTEELEEDNPEDDEDLKAAKAAAASSSERTNENKAVSTDSNTKQGEAIYKAPRLTSVEYLEKQEKILQDKERMEEKRRQKMRKSELLQTLRTSYGETPEEEDIDGGGRIGSSTRARSLAEKEAERIAYEESAMVRLTITRKEKKERNRILHEEKSNLRALSDLGNLTAGISAFVESTTNNDEQQHDDDEPEISREYYKSSSGGRHANGRRKRNSPMDAGEYGMDGRRTKNQGKGFRRHKNDTMVERFAGGKKRKNKR